MDTRSNEAQFTNIPPGSYLLRVKYGGGGNADRPVEGSIPVVVRAPWWQSGWACLLYVLLTVVAAVAVIRYIRWKYEQRKVQIAQRLDARYREEMYENKLRFFTNITHEFCTPLTLICGPCDRILHYERSDSFIKKYVSIIKANSERLNTLIQEIIDFRRIETGNQHCLIQPQDVSGLTHGIIESFSALAEQNEISLQTDMAENIRWNTDATCFHKIVSNLLSNAFKYTPRKGSIRVVLKDGGRQLELRVFNTGRGIRRESIPYVFNRYVVLDNVKENSVKGLSSRNGLGLAICHSMVELLQGQIRIESEEGRYAEFIVTLPALTPDEVPMPPAEEKEENALSSLIWELPPAGEEEETADKRRLKTGKQTGKVATVLVIDDNKELLWMLKDILSGQYEVLAAESAEEGLELIRQQEPDLIVTDIMMPGTDGLELTRLLKENRHTMHIPLVILSAKNTTDEKIEGIRSGADAYIAKPFKVHYLKAVIGQLLERKKQMKEYYHSSASTFGYRDGRLMQQEDREFLQAAMQAIDSHMDDSDFGPEELARDLQTSSRNLYRKLKTLGQPSPRDFIKERRIAHAALLLRTTRLTIQEVMYRTAFANRSHFYKEFAKRHHQTPKEYRENHWEQERTSLEDHPDSR